jgi:CRP/FNR family cyclic AMP-dependent transcriptional regulator
LGRASGVWLELSKNFPSPQCDTVWLPFLLRLAQKEGKCTPEGVEIIMPVSNQELASQIGTVRELVSRNLSRLQAEGMIKIDGRSVVVRNLKALEAELQSAD